MKRQRLSDEQWRHHLEAYERGGQSVAEFCAVHGLGESTFYREKQKRNRPMRPITASQPTARFIELKADPLRDDEATTPAHPTPLDLTLPRGVTVRVRRGFDATLLRQIVEVLQ